MATFEDIHRNHRIIIFPQKLQNRDRWTANVRVSRFGETKVVFEEADLPSFATKEEVIEYAVRLARARVDELLDS